jgi:hypothetical protein
MAVSPSNWSSATSASSLRRSTKSFFTLRCRRLTKPSGWSGLGLDATATAALFRLTRGAVIEMTFGQCDAAFLKNGFYRGQLKGWVAF